MTIPSNEQLKRELFDVAKLLEEVVSVAKKCLPDAIAKSPPWPFMVLAYARRQVQYAGAVCDLVAQEHYEGMALLARSMNEGHALLLFAKSDPERWAQLWLDYAVVEDAQLLQRQRTDGRQVDPIEEQRTQALLRQRGEQFLVRKQIPPTAEAPLDARAYRNSWHGKTLREIFGIIAAAPLYQWPYWSLSKIAHWSVRGMLTDMERDTGSVARFSPSPLLGAQAIRVAFQAVLETIEVADSVLSLGKWEQFERLRERYVSRCSRR